MERLKRKYGKSMFAASSDYASDYASPLSPSSAASAVSDKVVVPCI